MSSLRHRLCARPHFLSKLVTPFVCRKLTVPRLSLKTQMWTLLLLLLLNTWRGFCCSIVLLSIDSAPFCVCFLKLSALELSASRTNPHLSLRSGTACTERVRPQGSPPSSPSSQLPTTWMCTTTKVWNTFRDSTWWDWCLEKRVPLKSCVSVRSGGVEIREQRDEHPPVQLLPPPLLAPQLHGRLHVVAAFRGREG